MARVRHDDDAAEGGRKGKKAKAPPPDRGVLREEEVDEDLGPRLRPRTFDEYVGQTALKRRLAVFVRAARERSEPLDHTLLHGPPGLGKTTMAQILAGELGVRLHLTSGPAIEHKGVLAGHLTALNEGDALFIDEIHRLSPTVEESLYSAMEDGRIDLPVGEGTRARTMPFSLAPFTLIGATTRTALLSAPLRERFQIVEGIELYADEELQQIVARTSKILGMPATESGAREIGRRSRGTPRIANRLTRRVRDFAQVHGRDCIDLHDAEDALSQLGVDEAGLDATDRRILEAIVEVYDGGPVGIEAIAATLGEPRDTLEDVYEPFLLQRGFLARTPRGRQITKKALAHLGRTPAPGKTRGGRDPGQGELDL